MYHVFYSIFIRPYYVINRFIYYAFKRVMDNSIIYYCIYLKVLLTACGNKIKNTKNWPRESDVNN